MAKEDEENTAFITSQGIFCYSKMSFGLKNAGATYQRLVDKAFEKQIGRNLELYVDDLVIKSQTEKEVIRDIEETFKTLREINMKLNPKKCAFGMREGTFLGYKVDVDGLRVCPDKILADFIVESLKDDPLDTIMEDKEELLDPWVLFTDGSSCIDGSGAGLIIMNPEGMEFTYALRFRFNATNNEAEYEALIAGLRIAEQMGVRNLQANVDSRLVANQVNGIYIAKEPGMIKYLEKVKNLASDFKEFSIKQVPRGENKKADALSKMASTSFAHLSKQVLVEELKEKSIDEKEILAVVEEEGHTWMIPIYEYLTKEILPEEKSMHVAPRFVVVKALRSGYYWPTMHMDSRNLIRECGSCQVHRLMPRNPQQKLTPITSPWPFYKWGIDIAGPFPEGPGKVKFLIVAIDYFTKWIEAKPVATITRAQVKNFVWDNIVCRFGLPGEIISDNRKQFRDNPFKYECEKLCIRQCFASVKYPQANGLVERANMSLGEGIKARGDPSRDRHANHETAEVDMNSGRSMISTSGEALISSGFMMKFLQFVDVTVLLLIKVELGLGVIVLNDMKDNDEKPCYDINDAYKGYHQIQKAKEDEEKTAFITCQGIFCYSKMPFGLKNTGATYQRLVDKAFQKQIGQNLKVYVDDLVIKIRTEKEVIRDIEETFKTLREINMKLNPKKCAFGMREGTFLGYKVDADGLRVCPDKVEAVLNLPSPKCLKDVQKLNGKLASLNRFLSKSAEKSLPFFKN
ncbi:reverse transcriptase domain-containing protein [Tanacetum coccineum]